jgi:hypothetical protein
MTIAIRRFNGDILWFDAVEGFGEQYQGQTSKHPLGSGAFVTDHYVIENPRFSLKAVLSDADFNLDRPQLSATTEEYEGWQSVTTKKQYVNNTPVSSPVSINSSKNTFKSFLPESISQFASTSIPEVVVTEQPKVRSAQAIKMQMVAMQEQKEVFTLVDFNDSYIRKSWVNCIFTALSFNEDADTGEGVFPLMEIEQITFAEVKAIKVRIKNQTSNKGRQQTDASKRAAVASDKPDTNPTDYASQSASQRVNSQGAQSGASTP